MPKRGLDCSSQASLKTYFKLVFNNIENVLELIMVAEAKITIANYSNKKHAADILYLLDTYAQDPMGGGKPLSLYVKENLITKLSELPHALSVIGYVDAEPVGLINGFEGFSTFACKPLINIHDVVVLEKFRGQGISQLMLEKVESIAKEGLSHELLQELDKSSLLSPDGSLFIEERMGALDGIETKLDQLKLIKIRPYGKSALYTFSASHTEKSVEKN